MSEPTRDFRLIDGDGQLVERDKTYQQVCDQNEGLKNRVGSLAGTITQLQRELAEVRGIEPEAKKIIEVLEFYRDVSGRDKIAIDPSSQRWAKTRARLRQQCEPRITVDRLKTAIVGAPKAEWFGAKPERQDPVVVFNTSENVEKCEAAAGKPNTQQVRVVDVSPMDAAWSTLAREFGNDSVRAEYDLETSRLQEVWAMCPLHPTATPTTPLRLRARNPNGSLDLACVEGCKPDDIFEALRCLYGLQAARVPSDEIAELRVRIHELEQALRAYSWESFYTEDKHGHIWVLRDGGYMARKALGQAELLDESAA